MNEELFSKIITWAYKQGFEHGYEGENIWYNQDEGKRLTNKQLFGLYEKKQPKSKTP